MPFDIIGTNLDCSGVFVCAYLPGQGTNEQVFLKHAALDLKKKEKGSDEASVKPTSVGTESNSNLQNAGSKPKNSCIYWI